jgi:hypothetical protein
VRTCSRGGTGTLILDMLFEMQEAARLQGPIYHSGPELCLANGALT